MSRGTLVATSKKSESGVAAAPEQHLRLVTLQARAADQRREVVDDLELGVELPPEPFQRDDRLEHEREVGRNDDRVLAYQRRELPQQHRDLDVLERYGFVVEDEFVQVRGELRVVDVGVTRPVEQHLDHRLVVEPREPRKQIDHLAAPHRGEPSDHAEVDYREAIAGEVIDVARMRIGVEEAVDQDHAQHRVRAARGEELALEPGCVDRRQVGPGDSVDVLLHVHHLARVLGVDLAE